jgi:nucleoside-diphosphate-sugar epimerase
MDLRGQFAGRPVLVTGGASFIGSHLVEILVDAGASVRVADDLSSGRVEHLDGVRNDVELLIGDLRSADFATRAASGREVVWHLAAMHGGRGYIETHPVECMNNMVLDHVVLTACADAGISKFVHASSACVYPTSLQASSTERLLLKENDANFDDVGHAFADGEYGWAKLMGELQIRAFHKQCGFDAIACRIFTAYGERENASHAVIALIAKALARMDPYPIWGDGLQTRNFTYVKDTVRGLALAGAHLSGFDVINVGSPVHTSINELIGAIFDDVGWWPNEIERQLDKPVGVLSRAADVTKSDTVFGWSPSTSIRDGVAPTIEWCRNTFGSDDLEKLELALMER